MKPSNKRKRRQQRQTAEVVYLVNRKAEIVSCTVDDPYFNRAHDGAKGNTRQTMAIRNIRESPHAWYRARGWIDEHHAQAADKFRRLYERCAGSGLRAFDYGKEPVDGGFMTDGLTDARMDAAKELIEAQKKVGPAGYQLVEQVCGHLVWVKQLSRNTYESRQIMERLRDSLDTLSIFWGYRTRHKGRG